MVWEEFSCAPPGEDLRELLRRYDLELIEGAVARTLVIPPPAELRRVSKATPLHVVVRDFDDELRTQRLPRQILSRAPPTLRAGPAMRLAIRVRLRLRPIPPRMSVERVLAIWSEKLHQLQTLRVGKARADADVLEVSALVVQPEQQGTEFGFLTGLVPAEAGDDAVAITLVFHFQHDTLVRLIGPIVAFRDYAVEPGALETPEPIGGRSSVTRCWRNVKWRLHAREHRLESGASFAKGCVAKASIALA